MEKHIHRKKPRTILTLFAALTLAGGCGSTELPQDTNEVCSVTQAEFNGWFETGQVSLNGVVNPANSIEFSDVPNCDFYEWSEQMFLWLTSPSPPSYGGGSNPIFGSPAFFTVSPLKDGVRTLERNKVGRALAMRHRESKLTANQLPLLIEKKTLNSFEVLEAKINLNGEQLVLNERGEEVPVFTVKRTDRNTVLFFDREGKIIKNARPIIPKKFRRAAVVQKFNFISGNIFLALNGSIIEPEIAQASGLTLMSQAGSLVYYSSAVNEVFAYFMTGVKNGDIPVPPPPANALPWKNAQFPTTQDDLDVVMQFAADNGATPIDPEALAIEIKASWVEASSVDNPQDYITMNATIPTYTADASNETWTESGHKVAKLAMVGLHVVGSTAGHPELLWATFEHVGNTPNVAYSVTNQNGNVTLISSDVDDGPWLFSENGSDGPFNQPHMFSAGGTPPQITALDGFEVSPSDTIRLFPWGMDPDNAGSNTQIVSMNNSVRNKLIDGDVRKNYIQIGTTWTIFGADPTPLEQPGTNQVGTNRLANSTMETYDLATNCFTCHLTNEVEVSAIFNSLDPLF